MTVTPLAATSGTPRVRSRMATRSAAFASATRTPIANRIPLPAARRRSAQTAGARLPPAFRAPDARQRACAHSDRRGRRTLVHGVLGKPHRSPRPRYRRDARVAIASASRAPGAGPLRRQRAWCVVHRRIRRRLVQRVLRRGIQRVDVARTQTADCTKLDAAGRNLCVDEIYAGTDGLDGTTLHTIAPGADGRVWFTQTARPARRGRSSASWTRRATTASSCCRRSPGSGPRRHHGRPGFG